MTQITESTATATLSGRELALKRRQAMALHGKTGLKKTASASAKPASAAPSGAALVAQAGTAVSQNGRSVSRARREALSLAGKAALKKPANSAPAGRVREKVQVTPASEVSAKSCGCGCNGTKGGCGATQDTVGAMTASAAGVPVRKAEAPSGRALARARRAALSQDGKAGLKRVAQATKIAAAMPGQDWEAAIAKGATGRQIAMQRRAVQSLAGRTEASNSSRPSGRMRARVATPAPAKVEEGHTLSGRGVTGTMVERSKKVTGNEPGSCRAVTGTEYIGAEQFDTLCSKRPAPAPSKVGTGDTAKGKPVTGTQVGHSEKVTGDEPGAGRAVTGTGYALPVNVEGAAPQKVAVTHTSHGKSVTGTAVGHTGKITGDENGACRGITGTEYLAQEQFQSVCSGAVAPVSPRKVSVMVSRASQPVSGTEVGRSAKVTGDEPGSCRNITGSQYYTSESFGALCDAAVPRKVATMQTLSGRALTGTEVGRSQHVTGDERDGCKPVTGTEYIGADQQQALCAASTPVAPVAKVAVDQTWRGQPVTGTYVGRSATVTGDEPGGCSPISGTPYIGRGQYNGFCESPALQAQEARIRSSAVISATAVTGDRPGAGGSVMTGDERGACEVVSGTPYVGQDNTATQCATSGRFVQRANTWVEPPRQPAPMDFSIASPARIAQQNRVHDVTGTVSGGERITGPINKADGLITGTPEFRHHDAAGTQTARESNVTAAQRLTGEGSQAGRAVTGDAWNALSRVTGTEGTSSLSRNPSARGNPRGMGANAQIFREIEHPAVEESRITGSSGNSAKGALVTLSGGARG